MIEPLFKPYKKYPYGDLNANHRKLLTNRQQNK